jgi:hypothetical protein
MLNNQIKEWYTKEDILKIFPIKHTTYKLRIKGIPSDKTRMVKSPRGKDTREIHHSVLDQLFQKRRKLSTTEMKKLKHTIKWVNNHSWNYFCNIKPVSASKEDNVKKMKYLYEKLSLINSDITLFYSIENNFYDKYFHTHFLIDCATDMLSVKDIEDILSTIVDPNTKGDIKTYIKKYDEIFGKRGAKYSSKEEAHFYELLYPNKKNGDISPPF